MSKRFKTYSRSGRRRISKSVRKDVYARDDRTCQYCLNEVSQSELTIDHVLPLELGGMDEVTNYVTCCRRCNQDKANLSPEAFGREIGLDVAQIPVHGDPVIDNHELPTYIRLIRKRIFDRVRKGQLTASGKSAQQRIEKEYRREFWSTPAGQALESLEPTLPGHVRIMIPEIKAAANSEREYELLVELAKSADTRDLINVVPKVVIDVEDWVRSLEHTSNDPSRAKRIKWALRRFDKRMRSRESVG